MKKYKNVRAVKAKRCVAFSVTYGSKKNVCLAIKEPCETTCGGYVCKCTEYKYDKKRGKLI